MAAATGVHFQQWGGAVALLTVASFVHSGVPIPPPPDEEPASGLSLWMEDRIQQQTIRPSIAHFFIIPAAPAETISGGVSTFLEDRVLQQTLPQALIHPSITEEPPAEEPAEGKQLLLFTEPIPPTPSFTGPANLLEDLLVSFERLVVEAEQIPSTPSFLFNSEVPPVVVAPDQLEITRSVIVEAEPLPPTPSLVHGGVAEFDVVQVSASGLSLWLEDREQQRTIRPSITHFAIIPDEAAESISGGVSVFLEDRLSQQTLPPALVHPSIVEEVAAEDPPEGKQLSLFAEPVPETPSFIQAANLREDLLVSYERLVVVAEPLHIPGSFTLGAITEEIAEQPPEGKALVQLEPPIPPTPSFVFNSEVPADVVPGELPEGKAVIVAAEPIDPTPSFVFAGEVPADAVEPSASGLSLSLEDRLAQQTIPFSFLFNSEVPEDAAVSTISGGVSVFLEDRLAQQTLPATWLFNSEVPADVIPEDEPEITRWVIVEAEQIPIPPSFMRGMTEEIDHPSGGLAVFLRDRSEGLTQRSFTLGTFLAVEVFPEDEPEITRWLVVEAEPIPPQPSFTGPANLLEDLLIGQRQVIVAAEPLQLQFTLTHPSIAIELPEELPEGKAIIVAAEPLQPQFTLTHPAIAIEPAEEPPEGKALVVDAEPLVVQYVFTHSTFLAVSFIPTDPPAGKHLVAQPAEPVPPQFALTHSTFLAEEVEPVPEEEEGVGDLRRRFYGDRWNQFAETFDAFLRRQQPVMEAAVAEAPATQPIAEISKAVLAEAKFAADLEELEGRVSELEPTTVDELLAVLEPQVESIITEIADEEAMIAFIALVATNELDLS